MKDTNKQGRQILCEHMPNTRREGSFLDQNSIIDSNVSSTWRKGDGRPVLKHQEQQEQEEHNKDNNMTILVQRSTPFSPLLS